MEMHSKYFTIKPYAAGIVLLQEEGEACAIERSFGSVVAGELLTRSRGDHSGPGPKGISMETPTTCVFGFAMGLRVLSILLDKDCFLPQQCWA